MGVPPLRNRLHFTGRGNYEVHKGHVVALGGGNLLSPWNKVLLENLTGSQIVKEFPAFYGTPRFITAFTGARHVQGYM
jgi:hypothetical protein